MASLVVTTEAVRGILLDQAYLPEVVVFNQFADHCALAAGSVLDDVERPRPYDIEIVLRLALLDNYVSCGKALARRARESLPASPAGSRRREGPAAGD